MSMADQQKQLFLAIMMVPEKVPAEHKEAANATKHGDDAKVSGEAPVPGDLGSLDPRRQGGDPANPGGTGGDKDIGDVQAEGSPEAGPGSVKGCKRGRGASGAQAAYGR